MKSPEGPVQDAAWQWDGEADGADAVSGDVLGGGGPDGGGPRLSRRGLLIGAGVLAAGGAAWALGRVEGDGPTPSPSPSGPQPTATSGPTPLWTYRGPQAMTPERLLAAPQGAAFLSKAGWQALDPDTGRPGRLLVFDPPAPKDWPSDRELPAGKVAVWRDYLYTATSRGHLDAHHLTDPTADWSLALPDELDGQVQLTCLSAGVLYGCLSSWPRSDGSVPSSRIFAVRLDRRSLLWSVAVDHQERPVAATAPYDKNLLACVRSTGERIELVVRDATTGEQLSTAAVTQDLGWCVASGASFLVPDSNGGVSLLGPDGKPVWNHTAARGESWRALPPVPDVARVLVLRNDGVVTCLEPRTGAVLWSVRLPFLLDSRSRPLVVGGTLYVPGPAAGGVAAIYTATGTPGWTFHDSGPGRDVWNLAADGSHLYAGHDDVLHALPLT
ncbi:PQQ-binding-like beta-propeller repeat protein [Kitasatospora sp. NPDC098652]|uniref:outer membrane protein assembly factor BamB family protein n=1 Tax=Kitasatospora sp. NPDC098652 TaxID=3364095 RepID=UPI00380F53DE